MNIIHEKCDPKLAEDRKLPYTAYLIEYEVEGKPTYDITMGDSQVEIFDAYYDKYKNNFIGMEQSAGRVAPNRWNVAPPPPKKKKRRRKPEGEQE